MNLRPGHKEESVDVNLTPLIDVVFLLLIFFMVSTTFDRHAKLKVSLPAPAYITSSPSSAFTVLSSAPYVRLSFCSVGSNRKVKSISSPSFNMNFSKLTVCMS
ncbi:MAG: hypothetical protein COB77_06690 [Gammaproteobacteria bacterium]|nr:MAG: hypothetical protein COB77_06690 [Gammaproteobacteria bacterium]